MDCDVRDWEQQKNAFKTAALKSKNGFIDIVIANAGISGDDPFLMDSMFVGQILFLKTLADSFSCSRCGGRSGA